MASCLLRPSAVCLRGQLSRLLKNRFDRGDQCSESIAITTFRCLQPELPRRRQSANDPLIATVYRAPVAKSVLQQPVSSNDELPAYNIRRREWIKGKFYGLEWHQAYDFVEFIATYQGAREYTHFSKREMHQIFNRLFEAELSGYRFLGGELVPISNGAEVEAIEAAISLPPRPDWPAPRLT